MANTARVWAPRAAGALAIASLQIYWFLQPVALPLKGFALLLVAVSVVRPAAGLLAFAGLAPISTVIATLCGAPGMGGQLLEQMALGVGAGALLRGRPPEGRTRIGAPALFMAVVAVASAAALIPAAAAPVARSLSDGLVLQQLALRETAQSSPVWSPLFAALVIAEGGLLAWAVERAVRHSSQLATRLVVMGLIGHAAAALLNLQAVVGGALRTGDLLHALPQLLMSVRVNVQTDVNAGASALLLAGVAGIGLIKIAGARRVGVWLLLLLVAVGLWITGSRIALAMGAGAVIAAIGWPAIKTGRRRLMTVGAALLILAVGVRMVISGASNRSTPLPRSVELRWVMAKAGVEMFKEAPVFGIGVSHFYDASEAYAGPYLLSVGWQPRENAHNNFVQVLAEQGLVGLGALFWMLAIPLGPPRTQTSPASALRGGLMLAVVACLGTWFTGHPLLVPEFAFVFWFYCGVLAALTPSVALTRAHWWPWVLVALVLLSVPPRAVALRNAANLEHQGFGLSPWQHDDSQRYREAGSSFTLFLPASGQPTLVPVRRAPGAPDPLVVEVRIRGRLVDRVYVGGESWQSIKVVVQQGAERYEAVDFAVSPQTSAAEALGALLRVGKAVAR